MGRVEVESLVAAGHAAEHAPLPLLGRIHGAVLELTPSSMIIKFEYWPDALCVEVFAQ